MHEQRIKIGEGGRVVIPTAFRKALDVQVGDELILKIRDGELRLFHQKQALSHLRMISKHRNKAATATDEFLNFRKRDSGKE